MDFYLVALISAAKKCGLKVPTNINTYNPQEYPKFHTLFETCMTGLSEEDDNSKVFHFHRWVLQVINDFDLNSRESSSKLFG